MKNSRTAHLLNVATAQALATEESVDMVIVLRTDLVHMAQATVVDTTIPLLQTPQQHPQRLVPAVQPLELIILPNTLSTTVLPA